MNKQTQLIETTEADILTAQQRKALEALLIARTTKEAADKSGTPERTLSRWLTDETFTRELNAAQREVLGGAIRGLGNLAADAVGVFRDVVTGADTHPMNLRLQAADKLLSHMLNMKRAFDLEQRLEQLERENQQLLQQVNDRPMSDEEVQKLQRFIDSATPY